jgi:transposase
MMPAQRYKFDSIDVRQMLDSPELPEMLAALLELYHAKCQSEERQEETIQSLLDRIYGSKSEKSKYHPEQMLLLPELLEELVEAVEVESCDDENDCENSGGPGESLESSGKTRRKGGHGRSKLPADIQRRVVERIDMDDPNCETCDEERPIIRIEKSERLNYIPPKAIVDVTEIVIRGPLPCECDEDAAKIVRPEMPVRPIDRGMPGVDLLNSIVIGKFLYHLPHYRQVTKTLKDVGINLSKQTLWDWTRKTAELLDPLWGLMRRKLLVLDHLAADETTAQMVDRDRPGARTKTTYLWQYFGFDDGDAPYTVFDFAQTRAHTAPETFLEDFDGTLLTDGYSAYRALPNITHAGCMAHARRKFDEALTTSPMIAAQAVALIGKLYKIEDECRSLDADARRAVRRRRSSVILLRLRMFLEEKRNEVLPQSKIGKAVGYALNQWPDLCRFVDDGRLPIDNNAVEREMKAIATGRKNWMFFGSPRGGRAAAIIYSIIASARRHGLDVWQYLGDILRRLADLNPGELPHLLPDAWQQGQTPATQPSINAA